MNSKPILSEWIVLPVYAYAIAALQVIQKREEMTENIAVTQLQPKTGNRGEKRCYGIGDWGNGCWRTGIGKYGMGIGNESLVLVIYYKFITKNK